MTEDGGRQSAAVCAVVGYTLLWASNFRVNTLQFSLCLFLSQFLGCFVFTMKLLILFPLNVFRRALEQQIALPLQQLHPDPLCG